MYKPRKRRRKHELCWVLMLEMTKGQEHFSICIGKCQETENYDVPIAEFKPFHSSCLTMSYLTWIEEMDTDNPITVQTWLHQQLSHTWQVSHPSMQNFQHNWIFLLKPVGWEIDGIQNVLNQKIIQNVAIQITSAT